MNQGGYQRHIDGLRAISVLAVIVFHINSKLVPGGYFGVDVFFVISGYLITGKIAQGLIENDFCFRDFYARRARSIFPPLVLILLSSILVGYNGLFSHEFKTLALHAFSSAVFSVNFTYAAESGYFDTASNFKPFLHLWSLAVEEQFYLVWPILLFATCRFKQPADPQHSARSLLRVAVILTAISIFAYLCLIISNPDRAFYFSPARFWELGVGAIVALSPSFVSKKAADQASLIGLLLILASFAGLSDAFIHPDLKALIPVVGCGLVISSPVGAASVLLSHRWLVWVGTISYSLYLWHWPIGYFLRVYGWSALYPPIEWITLPLSLLLAQLSAVLIERPIKKWPLLPVALVATAGLAFVAFLGWNIYSRDGLDFRDRLVIEGFGGAPAESDTPCLAKFRSYDPKFCRIKDPSRPVDILILGDSIGHNAFEGVAAAYARRGQNVAMVGWPGVTPVILPAHLYGKYEGQRGEQSTRLLMDASAAGEWQAIFFVSRLPYEMDPEIADLLLPSLKKIKDSSPKRLVYVFEPPHLPFEPIECHGVPPLRLSPRPDCQFKLSEMPAAYFENRGDIHSFLKQNQIQSLDVVSKFCDEVQCKVRRNGHVMYRTVEGSKYVYGAIAEDEGAVPPR